MPFIVEVYNKENGICIDRIQAYIMAMSLIEEWGEKQYVR